MSDPGLAPRREVSARLELSANVPTRLVLAAAVADSYERLEESLVATEDGRELSAHEIQDLHGTRLHVIDVQPGTVEIRYAATVAGLRSELVDDDADDFRYLRPSRYCESDALVPTALAEFRGIRGPDLLAAVSSWVGTRLYYEAGSSLPTDGALRTLLSRRGVCRDYAHLVVGLLRALDVPARVVAVYAPGLSPMDFHAVAEARIDGEWRVVDATALAPRSTLVRIATGRDAADTAFLSAYGGEIQLLGLEVTAVADELPDDDLDELVSIG